MSDTPVSDLIAKYEQEHSPTHAHGSLNMKTIRAFERLAAVTKFKVTAETGCGKSTILFSNVSENHLVFCLDDRVRGAKSSVNYFMESHYSNLKSLRLVFGPTQITVPRFLFNERIDCVLIDGPHGFPFAELEYYFFYPHIRPGGFLIIDDLHIPCIRPFWDIVREEAMFDVYEVIDDKTGILRRTDAPTFNPLADGWWEQRYNRRRVPKDNPYYLAD